MKNAYCLLLIFLYPLGVEAQPSTMEVFYSSLESLQHTEQVDRMNEKYREIACVDSIESERLYRKIREALRKEKYNQGEVIALGYYAYSRYCLGVLDSSLFFFKKAALLAEEYRIYAEQADMLKNAGNIFLVTGKYDSSLYYYDLAYGICQTLQDSSTMSGVLIGKGIVYQNLGDLEKAMATYVEAEEISAKSGYVRGQMTARLNRYTILYDHFRDRLNKEEYIAALEICRSHQLKHEEATLLQFLGSIAADSADYEEAMSYYTDGMRTATEIGRIDLKVYHMEGIAHVYYQQGNYSVSLTWADKAIEEAKEHQLLPNLVQLYVLKARASIRTKNYRQAIIASNKSLEASSQTGQKEVSYRAYSLLAEAHEAMGDHASAYAAQKKYTELSAEILDEQKSEQIADLQTKYETEKIAAEKAIAENRAMLAEVERDKNLQLFIGAVAVVFLIIVATLLYLARLKQAKKAELTRLELKASQRQLALEKQYRDSELKALKAQMNPHFIFNVLNSIQEFIVLNQKDLASDYLAMFAELIRSYLHFSNKGFISLREEVETLDRYLQLESLRFGEAFVYHLSTQESLPLDDFKIPTMILQPYVENAVKHGLFNKKGKQNLSIDFTHTASDMVQCTITDDGIGRKKAQEIKESRREMHRSFAMDATADRLALYNQRSTQKISVETIDLYDDEGQPAGTKVIVVIPSM